MNVTAGNVLSADAAVFHVPDYSLAYRRDIDGLRAIAVLCVLVFHAFPSALPGGFVGVDVFFVISGYLITRVIQKELRHDRFRFRDFYARRVQRIFPSLLVVLLACLSFGWTSMLAEDLAALSKQAVAGAGFAANLLFWRETSYFEAAAETKPLLHLWSLGVEEQFYIAWPIVMALVFRTRIRLGRLVALAAMVSFILCVATTLTQPTAAFYSPLSRAWQLLLGAAMVSLPDKLKPGSARFTVRDAISIIGLFLIVVSVTTIDRSKAFPGAWAAVPTFGAVALIWAGPAAWVNRALLSNRLMVGVGLISFPLYLWHWPLLALGRSIVGTSASARSLTLAVSVVLAWGTWLLVERPMRFGPRRSIKVAGLTVAMAVSAAVALAIHVADGAPSRYPVVIQNATRYNLDGFREGIRWKKCFLEFEQVAPEFSPECIDSGTGPLTFLWGDSGAAALYPGLRSLSTRLGGTRLAQFTSSACPPLIGFSSDRRPACKSNNEKAVARLQELRPDIVLLAALWQYYDTQRLADTIRQLKAQGVERVVVIGPGLTWEEPPARILLRTWQQDPIHRTPPARLDYAQHEGLRSGAVAWIGAAQSEATVQRIAEDSGAEFLSIQRPLCERAHCLVRSPGGDGDSFFLDTAHFNSVGSTFVVNALAQQLRLR
jgi:peptidoglycan/LPS O-acetylase OafA/YrhL